MKRMPKHKLSKIFLELGYSEEASTKMMLILKGHYTALKLDQDGIGILYFL